MKARRKGLQFRRGERAANPSVQNTPLTPAPVPFWGKGRSFHLSVREPVYRAVLNREYRTSREGELRGFS